MTWIWVPLALFAVSLALFVAFCLGADYGSSFERRKRGGGPQSPK